EVAVDLVDAVEPAHDKALQVKLGGNPQIEVDVERVVMSNEGPGHGAARQRLHHGRLDFQITFGLEKIADGSHQLAASLKNRARFLVHHQVQVTLAVADFHIGEAVPFFRQRQHRLGEKLQALRVDAEFTRPGTK